MTKNNGDSHPGCSRVPRIRGELDCANMRCQRTEATRPDTVAVATSEQSLGSLQRDSDPPKLKQNWAAAGDSPRAKVGVSLPDPAPSRKLGQHL